MTKFKIFIVAAISLTCGCTAQRYHAEKHPQSPTFASSDKVHAFYYTWYGNPETNGEWLKWDHPILEAFRKMNGRYNPPEQIGSNFYPQLGPYSSQDQQVLITHMKQLRDAHIGVISVSWWGRGTSTDIGIPEILRIAGQYDIKVNFHLEPYPGRNAASVKKDIIYIIDQYGSSKAFYRDPEHGNKPMFYAYDSYLIPDSDWASILAPSGDDTIRGTDYDSIVIGLYCLPEHAKSMIIGHFDGCYTYFAADGSTYGSVTTRWPKMRSWAKENGKIFIPSVGPGYADLRIRKFNIHNQRDREDGEYYDRMFQRAIDTDPDLITITSFNEWHEGTQIEPAVPKKTPTFTYLDYAPHEPDYYLEKTRYWVDKFQQAKNKGN